MSDKYIYVPAQSMRSSGTEGLCIRKKRSSYFGKYALFSKMLQRQTLRRWCGVRTANTPNGMSG